MPQLDPTWFASQLFWLFVAFMTLYVVLSRFMLPPLLEVMERRKATVDSDLQGAERFKTEAEKARDHYERTLADARLRSQQLIDTVMQEHKAKSEQASKALDDQIAAKLKEADRRISAKKQELMEALTPATAEMTALIVEKLTQRSPNKEEVKTTVGGLSKGRA